jgi:hypothetical protein
VQTREIARLSRNQPGDVALQESCAARVSEWTAIRTGRLPAFADLVRGEGVLDARQDPLLGGAGQLADAFEKLSGFARRAAGAGTAVFIAQEVIDGDVENLRQPNQMLGFEGGLAALPAAVALLGGWCELFELRKFNLSGGLRISAGCRPSITETPDNS